MLEFQKFNSIPRLSRECVISEKLDGTNAQIYIEDISDELTDILGSGHLDEEEVTHLQLTPSALILPIDGRVITVRAGSRKGFITPEKDNYGFASWVYDHGEELVSGLGPGRHYGEWWGQGIQRGYDQEGRTFSLFNTGRWKDEHLPLDVYWNNESRMQVPKCCSVVPIITTGFIDDWTPHDALSRLEDEGSLAGPGFKPAEGIVIYHSVADIYFKKTLLKDEMSKTEAEFRAKA